jgi:peptidoglycan-N-acetylglucosamine deacetylase
MLAVGAALTACGVPDTTKPRAPGPPAPKSSSPAPDLVAPLKVGEPTKEPGGVVVLRGGPPSSGPARAVALTVDDGFCAGCVSGYVAFVQRSGIHLTFSPNGCYAHAWTPHAPALRPLIHQGQLQLMNHTFTHRSLPGLPAATVREELERNEDWITRTFATTTRPYYRPPFGRHNPEVNATAAAAGFDRVVLWNGSYSDSELITPQFLMGQARKYLAPRGIVLGHANHPTVLGLFDQLLELITQRALTPTTLDEMFGTRRPTSVTPHELPSQK